MSFLSSSLHLLHSGLVLFLKLMKKKFEEPLYQQDV